jgi:glyoxylase-like metal-dependent hydrolase (beta-lactamase superfamily II)
MPAVRIWLAAGLTVAALAAPLAMRQQPTGDPFSTEIRKVKEGLWVIPGYDGAVTGGNVAVRVTNEGVIIVDDRLPPSSKEIAGKIRSVTPQPIKYVMSSHNHGDHTGGHVEFIATAEIIAHRNNRANMLRGKQAALPRVVFADQASVFLGGAEVQAIHFGRGHTDGDAVTYFPDLRTVHTGDLVVWGKRTDGTILTPYVDRRNGGSLNEWVATIESLLRLDFDTAIPGHGPVLTKSDIEFFHKRLITLRERMTAIGKSGIQRAELPSQLNTVDLGWPFPPERLDELWDEFGTKK